jgi:hypothetical protein
VTGPTGTISHGVFQDGESEIAIRKPTLAVIARLEIYTVNIVDLRKTAVAVHAGIFKDLAGGGAGCIGRKTSHL